MPLFTRENAAEMARRARLARTSNVNQRTLAAAPANETAEDDRRKRLGVQIDILDRDIERTKNAALRCKLIASKAKLWTLLYPETGKGKTRDRALNMAPVSPLPIVNPPPIVAPLDQANHNGEIIQSQSAAA